MPQTATKALEQKKLIDAGMPKNISEADKAKLEAQWAEQAKQRNEIVARETKIPENPTKVLRYELHKFGKHWNAYSTGRRGKLIPLLVAPSLFISAVNALEDKMVEESIGEIRGWGA